ncbi:gamma-glutamylcyclotransferase-like isoform X2 [Belonocnema kinseyi]|nr:gamma-glutamylcyclotransferase-like isoform X2 [Belonocnema kinseyi]XP_033207644.1 gamma-glutamylcyclotransferase-like isoform X2 [Belonocnema kinseyi]XP_033207645.1 gamma-glutamylcyclotransferase-like isoform X2 [Belonocnema kinseyi]XP_033207646.1 gamma-glutamylcyclotransferase-like isoform X2 [Belonocnema kinseyi]
MSNTFLYFSYGSNLFSKRIHINNPTAIKKTTAQLKNYRLDFNTFSKNWKGASATIVPTEGFNVWGVVWEIDNSNLPCLDKQEGVADNIYFPLKVSVKTPEGQILDCRSYQQCNNPEKHINLKLLPEERQPSPQYLNVILKGARENHLPTDYIQFLESISHNGYNGEIDQSLAPHGV